MKYSWRRNVAAFVAVVLAVSTSGCGGDTAPTATPVLEELNQKPAVFAYDDMAADPKKTADSSVWLFGGEFGDSARTILHGPGSNMIIAGYTSSMGAGGSDFYLLEIDIGGNLVWQRTFGGPGDECGYCAVVIPSGGYAIVGATTSFGAGGEDIYVVRTDSDGNQVWAATLGGAGFDRGTSICTSVDDHLIVAGRTSSFEDPYEDLYVAKLDYGGALIWERTYGGAGLHRVNSVIACGDGSILCAGSTDQNTAGGEDIWLIKIDQAGNELWQRIYGGSSTDFAETCIEASDGGYVICGGTRSSSVGAVDAFLLKTDFNGDSEWYTSYGGTGYDDGLALAQTVSGNIIMTGRWGSFSEGDHGPWDAYMMMLDSQGTKLWQRFFGGPEADNGFSVTTVSLSGLVMAGVTASFGEGTSDMYVIKTNLDGDLFYSAGGKSPGLIEY